MRWRLLARLGACVGILAGLALLAEPGPERPPAAAWLGPLAAPLAQAWWVRADVAATTGDHGRALELYEGALELDPSATGLWAAAATHMGLLLASAEVGAPAAERRAWLETALALLARGERTAAHPEELAFLAGMILEVRADDPEETDRALPRAACRARATAAYEHAGALGHPFGRAAADRLRDPHAED